MAKEAMEMLGERLYELRRKQGMSQEQLAEKIGVSRQTISKWEGNLSTPDLDRLLVLADCFQMPVDELVRGDGVVTSQETSTNEPIATEHKPDLTAKLGLLLCAAGGIALAFVGFLMVAFPDASQKIGESSVITFDGRGVILLFCAAVMVFGVLLIYKKK